jgi:hypothetical protein
MTRVSPQFLDNLKAVPKTKTFGHIEKLDYLSTRQQGILEVVESDRHSWKRMIVLNFSLIPLASFLESGRKAKVQQFRGADYGMN